jgi:hypothetical protein
MGLGWALHEATVLRLQGIGWGQSFQVEANEDGVVALLRQEATWIGMGRGGREWQWRNYMLEIRCWFMVENV